MNKKPTITIFGCTGFLGRYVVNRFAQLGCRLILPYRGNELSFRRLKTIGQLGQFQFVDFDIYSSPKLAQCVEGSDIVINLIGQEHDTKGFKLAQSNVDSAKNIGHVCRNTPTVTKLIHLSHVSASPSSESDYFFSKYQSEIALLNEFPQSAVVRACSMFGHEDRLLHQIGWLSNFPFLPVPNYGRPVLRLPVFVDDVALGIVNLALDTRPNQAQWFEFLGPKTYTYEEIIDLWIELTRKPVTKVYPPAFVNRAFARFVDSISPYPTIHPDMMVRFGIDEQPQLPNSGKLVDVGVPNPAILEFTALEFVRRYRKHEDYHLPGREPMDHQQQ